MSRFFRACTGQMGDAPNCGIFIIFTESLFCIVLDHFMSKCTPGGVKNMSPLVNCSNGEKAGIECGTRLDILRKEKNATKYVALYTCPIQVVSHSKVIFWRSGMSIIFFILTENCHCIASDF